MIDSCFCSTELVALTVFCRRFANVIGPQKGRSAREEEIDGFGNLMPAQPGCGDPEKWYVCARTVEPVAFLPLGVEACSAEEGGAVLGVWA